MFVDGLKIKDLSGEEEAAAFYLLADMAVEYIRAAQKLELVTQECPMHTHSCTSTLLDT